MTIQKKQDVEFLLLEEKRLLSIIQNLKNNIDHYEGISFSNDLLNAETRLLLLRRKLDNQHNSRFK